MTFSYSILPCNNLNINLYQYTEIKVFYKTLKYTSILQQAKTRPEELVSNSGGYLGLFVGLSFISLFEITEIIFEIFFIRLASSIQPRFRRNAIIPQTAHDNERILRLETELATQKLENKEKIKELNNLITNIQISFEKKIKMNLSK